MRVDKVNLKIKQNSELLASDIISLCRMKITPERIKLIETELFNHGLSSANEYLSLILEEDEKELKNNE